MSAPTYQLHHGDCLDVLRTMADNSVDAVVTDPPYGLSFMGKKWDYDVPATEVWAECLRVLKPGGHLLAFAGTRTQHRMAVRIEDAGFEIRDMIAYVYGSGFPKSLDVSKAIDKVNGEAGRLHKFTAFMRTTGLTARQINEATGTFMGSHYLTDKSQPAIPTCALWAKLRPLCGEVPAWVDELVARIEAEREVVGQDTKARSTSGASALPTVGGETVYQTWDITAPATEAARQWQGWGTALKPALEPITVARKPLVGTVAENVLAWGTGGLNIDGCRIGTDDKLGGGHSSGGQQMTGGWERPWMKDPEAVAANAERSRQSVAKSEALGRWPANLIHDGSPEATAGFPDTGPSTVSMRGEKTSAGTHDGWARESHKGFDSLRGHNDTGGSAARFFYTAKASAEDRDAGLHGFEKRQANQIASKDGGGGGWANDASKNPNLPRANTHPTVKPTDLMRYLVRLVTPPGGVVLDPFNGSGSTGKACMLEGFNYIGCELSADYIAISRARIEHAIALRKAGADKLVPASERDPHTNDLFGVAA